MLSKLKMPMFASSKAMPMTLVATPALILYLVVFPGTALAYLYRHRRELHTSATVDFRAGFLFSGYSRDRWFWEALSLFRKVSIIMFVTFARGSEFQLHFALIMLV